MKLSAVILTHNEEKNISECMASLNGLADEIVVADSCSTDRTLEIAKSLGAVTQSIDSDVGYGRKRQQAQEFCHGDFIIHLDADERLTEEGRAEIRSALEKADRNTVLAIPRLTMLFDTPIHHCGWYPDYVNRVYAKEYTSYNDSLVHEHLILPADAKLVKLKQPMIHYSYTNLEVFFAKQSSYAIAYGLNNKRGSKSVSLWAVPLRGVFAFIKTYFLQGGYRDGSMGLWLSIAKMNYVIKKYLALYAALNGKRMRRNEEK